MPTTDVQREAADRIAAEYSGEVRITPNAGPLADLMVMACPDGRTVVLTPTGDRLADSRGGGLMGLTGPTAAILAASPAPGYAPSEDALVVETCDGEYVLVPPWRCAMTTEGHLPALAVEARLVVLREWYRNVVAPDGSLRVWRLPRGAVEIERAE